VPFYPAYSLFPSFRLLKLPTWRIPDRRCFRMWARERERIESKSSNKKKKLELKFSKNDNI
jgi:hypothetical protein